MKKIICLLLALCMTFLICSCGTQPTKQDVPMPEQTTEQALPEESTTSENGSFLQVAIGDKYLYEWLGEEQTVSVSWKLVELSEEDAKAYPKLQKAFETLNEAATNDAQGTFETLQSELKAMAENGREFIHLNYDAQLYMQRADSNLVSFLEFSEIYSGGAHPNYYYKGYNYNSETGELLQLTDLLTDVECLPELLGKKLDEKYPDVAFWGGSAQDTLVEYESASYQWTLDYEGINFWFSPYDLSSYMVGGLCVKVYFDEEPDLFRKEYTVAPSENYAIQLPMWLKVDCDLVEDDGKTDCVEINTLQDDQGLYNIFSVIINDEVYTDESNCAYEYHPYLVHTGGKNYLYYSSYLDGGYSLFCGFDLSDGTPVQISQLENCSPNSTYVEEGDNEGTQYQDFINNLDDFKLESTFHLLGTRGGFTTYQIDSKDGTVNMKGSEYTLTYGYDLTTKIPLIVTDLSTKQKTQIPERSVLKPLYTDGETYLKCETEDGREIQILVKNSDWPYTVNGIPEEDCFEELFYAG